MHHGVQHTGVTWGVQIFLGWGDAVLRLPPVYPDVSGEEGQG